MSYILLLHQPNRSLMKKFVVTTVAVFAAVWACATPDFSGSWAGYLTQKSPAALAENYSFRLTLEVNGDEISGHSEIRMWDEDIFGVMSLEGTFDEDEADLKETEIVRQQIYSFGVWCIKFMHLQYSEEGGRQILRGNWQSDACSGPGEVYLEKEMV